MKKNQWLIEQYKALKLQEKELKRVTNENVPEIYACFAKILIDEMGNTAEEVQHLFTRTQELWTELVEHNEVGSMIEWCEKTTGVRLSEDA